jgi:recombinational DNA repair protein RecT
VNLTADQRFAVDVRNTAMRQLSASLGTEAGKKAAQSLTMAFAAAARVARNPNALFECSPGSVAACVALSIETGLYPGGPNPTVYLVPQAARRGEQPELQWRITHRGLAILAERAGFVVRAVPVDVADHLKVSLGSVTEHESDPDSWPTWETLRGVAVVVQKVSTGATLATVWMPRKAIEQRRAIARDQGVWNAWSVEMSQKTAIKYVFSRGAVPTDSPELRAALEADAREDRETIDVEATTVADKPPKKSIRTRLTGDSDPAPAPDFEAENARLNERETVDAQPDPKPTQTLTLTPDESPV